MDWAYTLCGLIVGFVVGLTGLGGGSLMTPLLVLMFGIPPATAVGTDLLYAAITKLGGVWVHGKKGHVDWKLVAWLAMGSLPTAVLTSWALIALDLRDERLATLISGVLGVTLILTALAILFRESLRRYSRTRERAEQNWEPSRLIPATIATGAVLGVFVTISSVGAGAIGMVALLWLYPRLLTAVAGLGHFYMGTVDFVMLGSLLVGSLPGISLGSHVSSKVPDYILRPSLACMLFLVGGRLVF